MLLNLTEAKDFYTRLIPYTVFRPFPLYTARKSWDALAADKRNFLIEQAECALKGEWELLTAVRYMDYGRNGNRNKYEEVYHARRQRVIKLLLGECCEGKGRFIDELINGIWAICEESTWVVPAHNMKGNCREDKQIILPKSDNFDFIDLFAAATGGLLAVVNWLIGPRLAQESIRIPERLLYELRKRIFEPFMRDDRMWWMGFNRQRRLNNWTPWICSNIITAYLLTDLPDEERAAGIRRAAICTQKFVDDYAADGGCEEGPQYFGVAGGALLDILEMLDTAVYGDTELYEDGKIRNIAGYIYHMHVAGEYFVNFSDSVPRVRIPGSTILYAAERMQDMKLAKFVHYAYEMGFAAKPEEEAVTKEAYYSFWRKLRGLFIPCEKPEEHMCVASESHWYPGIQVAVAREAADSTEGFFFAAKGGCNAEAHNHNDVGNFVLYHNGEPLVIDVGCETYTRETFSNQRYELWQTQSAWHNTPRINGVEQCNGGQYRAKDVHFDENEMQVSLSMQIEDAYPWQAGVKSYRRQFLFDREKHALELTDTICTEQPGEVELMLMLAHRPRIVGTDVLIGEILLHIGEALEIAGVDEVPVRDELMKESWQRDTLYRLRLKNTEKKQQLCLKMMFGIAREE